MQQWEGVDRPLRHVTSAGCHNRVLASMVRVHPPAAVKHLRNEQICHALVYVQKVGTSAVCHVIGRCFS